MKVKKIFKRIITGFVALTTAATMFIGNGVSANCLQGDVNSDGTINIYDVIYISSCLAKNDITTIKNSGDYNKDGAVNIYDSRLTIFFVSFLTLYIYIYIYIYI